MKTVRVLSIDGGGIRGILPAVLLTALEYQSGRRIGEMFDFAAGTSTGALLAAALFKKKPLSAQQALDFYLRDGQEVFGADPLRHLASAVAGPKYDEAALERKLYEIFGDDWLSDCPTPLLLPSYELTTRQAQFFKSWKAQGWDLETWEYPGLYDYRLRHAVRASSAAPTYFRPAKFRSRAGAEAVFIDGAVVANNPSLCALASVRKLNPDVQRVLLVSLGTGQQAQPISYAESSTWGLINWARPALDCIMDGAADAVTYQVEEAFGQEVRQIRVDFVGSGQSSTGPIDDTSSANIRRLVMAGEAEVKRSAEILGELPGLLLGPEPT